MIMIMIYHFDNLHSTVLHTVTMFVTKFCLKRDFDYDSLDLKMMNNRRDIYRCKMKTLKNRAKCNVGISSFRGGAKHEQIVN